MLNSLDARQREDDADEYRRHGTTHRGAFVELKWNRGQTAHAAKRGPHEPEAQIQGKPAGCGDDQRDCELRSTVTNRSAGELRRADAEQRHTASRQHLFHAEPIETERANQHFSGDQAQDRRHRRQNSKRQSAIEVESRRRHTDEADDNQQREERQGSPEIHVGSPQADLELPFQSFGLRDAQQSRPHPLAHPGAIADAPFLDVGVLPHASRPKRLARMTSSTMTTVADTAMYASTDVKLFVFRRMTSLIPM